MRHRPHPWKFTQEICLTVKENNSFYASASSYIRKDMAVLSFVPARSLRPCAEGHRENDVFESHTGWRLMSTDDSPRDASATQVLIIDGKRRSATFESIK